jgi:hypothetical protein
MVDPRLSENPLPLSVHTPEYYMALGRFVSDFSELEGAMQVALWILSDVKSPTAQAIYSGVRAEDACNKITRIGDANRWSKPRKDEWKIIADRLGILRVLRNDILHYGAKWVGIDEWLISNKFFAHLPEKATATIISPKILGDATADIEKLLIHLWIFLFGDEISAATRGSYLNPALLRAWRYTPPPQAGRPGSSPGNGPKRPRQPRPSSASRRKAALERAKKT